MTQKGFIDLQINGYKGVDFSSEDLTLDCIRMATREIAETGTVAYCPTVVTSDIKAVERNLRLFREAMNDKELGGHLLGLHLEGPFISPEEGARGAHPLRFIRKPDIELYKKFQEWSGGHVKILTLAPEVEGALPLIEYASKSGTVVSLGHHMADSDTIEKAVKAGARASTHLGNGMPAMMNRHRNPLWSQLACDELIGMFIADGHHLPADFVKVALRAKTLKRFIVVSDAVHLAGLPPGKYDFFGASVALAANGRISFADTPYLAGSSATMSQCMNWLASLGLLGERELRQVGFDNPLELLGVSPADVAKLDGAVVAFRGGQFEVVPISNT